MAEAPKKIDFNVSALGVLRMGGKRIPEGAHSYVRADIAEGMLEALKEIRAAFETDDGIGMANEYGDVCAAIAKAEALKDG